jgi:hypothetical protein
VTESFELKHISKSAVGPAIERAERYRLLNDPEQAESICLDVLEVDPGNPQALVMLILAMTDQFGRSEGGPGAERSLEYVRQLSDEYQRAYYTGIIRERQARALLRGGPSKVFAYDGLRDAMEWYEKAELLRPLGNDEAILRWNACVRTIRRAGLRPWSEDRTEPPFE